MRRLVNQGNNQQVEMASGGRRTESMKIGVKQVRRNGRVNSLMKVQDTNIYNQPHHAKER